MDLLFDSIVKKQLHSGRRCGMLFVRFLQLLPPAHPQSLCRFADAAYPREGTET